MPEKGVLALHRTLRAGVYSTVDVRSPTEPAADTRKKIELEPPHAAGVVPKIAIGLCSVDLDGALHNARLRTSVSQDPGIAHKMFTATISS